MVRFSRGSAADPLSFGIVVLAGGRSRRLGFRKAALALRSGTWIDQMLRDLDRDVREGPVILAGARSPLPIRVEHRYVWDPRVEEGPLEGLAAALRSSQSAWSLVVTCDGGVPSPRLLRALSAGRHSGAQAVVSESETGFRPFPGLYHRTCWTSARNRVTGGERSLQGFLRAIDVTALSREQVRELDTGTRSFRNVNTLHDLARALRDGSVPGPEPSSSEHSG